MNLYPADIKGPKAQANDNKIAKIESSHSPEYVLLRLDLEFAAWLTTQYVASALIFVGCP